MNSLEGIVLASGIIISYWIYDRWSKTHTDIKILPQYTLVFDIDGTVTRRPGHSAGSLFDIYCNYPTQLEKEESFYQFFQSPSNKTDDAKTEYNMMKKFIQELSKFPKEEVRIIILTNNFKGAIKKLWEAFECSWERLDNRSAFRDDNYGGKLDYLAILHKGLELSSKSDNHRFLYFDDDPIYIPLAEIHEKMNTLRMVYCSSGSNSVGSLLTQAGLNKDNINQTSIHKFLEQVWSHPKTKSVK